MIASSGVAFALDQNKEISQFGLELWRETDGLPQASVLCLHQARDGYLWFGTYEGLVRFDGVRFIVFDRHNTPEFGAGDVVTSIVEDRSGALWIGTAGSGVLRLRSREFNAFTSEAGLSHDYVLSLLVDREDRLWVGTRAGLDRIENGVISRHGDPAGVTRSPDLLTMVLSQSRSGRMWIGTDRGLCELTTEDGDHCRFDEHFAGDRVTAVTEDRSGAVWVATTRGLFRIDAGGHAVFTVADGLPSNRLRSLVEDRDGNLWVGSTKGLARVQSHSASTVSITHGLSEKNVVSLLEGREGGLWLGTFRGLYRLSNPTVTVYGTPEGLSDDVAWVLLEDRTGAVWVGTAGGLDVVRDAEITTQVGPGGRSFPGVGSLLEDSDGALWMGGGGGLHRFANGRWTSFQAEHPLPGGTPTVLWEEKPGRLWVGWVDRTGIGIFEDERFTRIDGLADAIVTTAHLDRTGDFWVGTVLGLNRIRDGRVVSSYTERDGLGSSNVLDVHEDEEEDGIFWVSTYGGGLSRFKDGRITTYGIADGLFDDVAYQVLEDDSGRLWMGSNRGIFRVEKAELNAVAEGRLKRVSSVVYDYSDGLRSREVNGGRQSGLKSSDGRLWFPTMSGVAVIDPRQEVSSPLPPQVVIEEVRTERGSLNIDGPLHIPAGVKSLEIDYSGVTFSHPTEVAFRYRLEGIDDGWIEAGNRRIAYYTRIPPGQYVFRAQARRSYGAWDPVGASVSLDLAPRVYQTLWFWLLVASLVALLLSAMHRLRLHALEKRKDWLERALHESQSELVKKERLATLGELTATVSHELRNPLAGMRTWLHLLRRQVPGDDTMTRQAVTRLDRGIRRCDEVIDELLDFTRAGNIRRERTVVDQWIESVVEDLATPEGVIVCFELGLGDLSLEIDPSRMSRAIINVVENAWQAMREVAGPKNLTVRSGLRENRVELTFIDTGIGIERESMPRIFDPLFSTKSFGVGLGLQIVRQTLEAHGGGVEVHSDGNCGARAVLFLPAEAVR